ncbi:MAG: hypothetical protein K9K38_06265 [Rhodoferax sp.]|nr:hypothetical protein [Rhodoferax sp.]MCF8208992.1 hypothetical protein [Rhodoferax sp.]
MALSLNKPKLDNLTNEIWKSAERLRGKFKSYEYQSVSFALKPADSAAKDLLAEFWRLEKEAEKMLEGLAK